MCHFCCTEGHETWVLRTWIGGPSHCARIFRLRWAVCSEIERKRPNRPGCGQPVLAWNGDKVDFPCASGGEGPVLQSVSALGLNASSSTNRAMHDFVTKLALLSRMLGSDWCAICPHSSRIITGSASKAEKVLNFIKPAFPKKGVGEFSKKWHFWNQQGVSFRVVCFVCFEPSDPFQRTVEPAGDARALSLQFKEITPLTWGFKLR